MPRDLHVYHATQGSSDKLWAYPVDTTSASLALAVYYGRRGSALRLALTPAAQCHDQNAHREAVRRTQEKLGKGYVYQGQYTLADNRRELTAVVPAELAAPALAHTDNDSPTSCWYWRLSEQALHEQPFCDACQQTAQKLAHMDWALPVCKADSQGVEIFTLYSQGEFQGVLPLCENNTPQLVFWLLLARAEVGLSLANESGELVSAWPDAVPLADETLLELGLKPRNLRQLLAAVTDYAESWYFE